MGTKKAGLLTPLVLLVASFPITIGLFDFFFPFGDEILVLVTEPNRAPFKHWFGRTRVLADVVRKALCNLPFLVIPKFAVAPIAFAVDNEYERAVVAVFALAFVEHSGSHGVHSFPFMLPF